MNKIEKKLLSIVPGSIGTKVVDRDLPFAIREFKATVKSSGKLSAIKTFFEKPSTAKKRKMDAAKFEQYVKQKRSNK